MIEFQNLSKSFGKIKALTDVCFTAEDNRVTGILGPDGAGKTTLCRLLAGVTRPTDGDILVDGFSCRKSPGEVKKIIGYMPRDYGLYPDLTVEENIDFYADIFGVRGKELRERKDKILKTVRMDKFTSRVSGFLSGGMKQKLQLSCALIHSPKYLVLDEPGYGVDPVSRRDFWALVEDISDKTTILASTSYMDEAKYFDKIVILNKGKVVITGTEKEIISTMNENMYSVSCNCLAEVSEKTSGFYESMNLYGDRMHVVFKKGYSEESLMPFVKSGEIISIVPIVPSMEDVFIRLTNSSGL